jgi:hypothetical protein
MGTYWSVHLPSHSASKRTPRHDRICRFLLESLTRNLTDTAIRHPPDCAIDYTVSILNPWSYLQQLTYLTWRNWKCCGDSINFEHGILWMKSVTVWFAERLSPARRSKSPAEREGMDRCGLIAPPRVAIRFQLIGSCQQPKSWRISRCAQPSESMQCLRISIALPGRIPRAP